MTTSLKILKIGIFMALAVFAPLACAAPDDVEMNSEQTPMAGADLLSEQLDSEAIDLLDVDSREMPRENVRLLSENARLHDEIAQLRAENSRLKGSLKGVADAQTEESATQEWDLENSLGVDAESKQQVAKKSIKKHLSKSTTKKEHCAVKVDFGPLFKALERMGTVKDDLEDDLVDLQNTFGGLSKRLANIVKQFVFSQLKRAFPLDRNHRACCTKSNIENPEWVKKVQYGLVKARNGVSWRGLEKFRKQFDEFAHCINVKLSRARAAAGNEHGRAVEIELGNAFGGGTEC